MLRMARLPIAAGLAAAINANTTLADAGCAATEAMAVRLPLAVTTADVCWRLMPIERLTATNHASLQRVYGLLHARCRCLRRLLLTDC